MERESGRRHGSDRRRQCFRRLSVGEKQPPYQGDGGDFDDQRKCDFVSKFHDGAE